MPPSAPNTVHLLPTCPADLPSLFHFQLDPASNQLAGTKPHDLPTFNARWEEIFRDPTVTPRVITADGALVGSINIFKQEEKDSIGYWLAREHWGRGIATRAIALLLAEVPMRPLFARVAAHNAASLRALGRNGFAITSRRESPETHRYLGGETITLRLS